MVFHRELSISLWLLVIKQETKQVLSPPRTNIPARQNLRLTVVASSEDSAKNSLQLLYPNSSHSVKFSTQSTIPVIVDFNQTISTGEVNYARVLLDGNPILGVMNQHEVPDPTNPQLNDYITHRYTTSIDPRFTSLGKHILQAVLYSAETNNPIAQTDFIEIEITDYAQLSPTATLQEIPEDFRHITDTSSVVFSVNAEDLDASIQSVQYYVNGVAHAHQYQEFHWYLRISRSIFFILNPNQRVVTLSMLWLLIQVVIMWQLLLKVF